MTLESRIIKPDHQRNLPSLDTIRKFLSPEPCDHCHNQEPLLLLPESCHCIEQPSSPAKWVPPALSLDSLAVNGPLLSLLEDPTA